MHNTYIAMYIYVATTVYFILLQLILVNRRPKKNLQGEDLQMVKWSMLTKLIFSVYILIDTHVTGSAKVNHVSANLHLRMCVAM